MLQKPKIKILIIGSFPPPIGGTTVSIECLTSSLRNRNDVILEIVDTSRVRNNIFKSFGLFKEIFFKGLRVDVLSVHISPTALPFLGPLVVTISRLQKRPLIIRIFGGMDYSDLPWFSKIVARWTLLRSDIYLAQTKSLIKSALNDGIRNVSWFPTHRPVRIIESREILPYNGLFKFIYVGHIRPEKGIWEILSAAEGLPKNIQVDLYGPLCGDFSRDSFRSVTNVHYCGIIDPQDVSSVLRDYHALVLPTYHQGEGYPGIIIEAFCAGIPIVCTRWMSLPELVDNDCAILVKPRDSADLRHAMRNLASDRELYCRLAEASFRNRNDYDVNYWSEKFVEHCRELIGSNDYISNQ